MDRWEIAAFLVLMLLALALRLHEIDRPLYGDEADWYKSALIIVDGNSSWTNTFISDSPPLGKAVFAGAYAITHTDNFRYVTLAFAMGSLAVAYFLAREFFGKRSALLSLLLLATSAYSAVGAQHLDRDGGMLAFLSLLTFYAYMKRKEGMVWLGIAVLSFMAAVLMRTNMLVLLVPIFALEYCRHEGKQVQKAKIAAKNLLPFAAAFVVSFAVWALMDAALGIQTMQKTFAHYFTYATGSNQDIGTRLLRTGVSIARVLARLTVPMALAFCISAWALWKGRWEMEEREKGLLVVCGAWVFMGVLSALLVTQGNVPAYFAPIVPAVVLVVGHAVSKIERVGAGFVAMAVVLSLAYSGTLQYIDFNEVNLLLMPAAALGAVALGGVAWFVDKEPRRLAAVLALMSLCASGFMLTDYRTYDAMRSESVADAAAYFNAEGAQKIAESQERTLDLYVHGGVVQYFGNAQCAKVDGRVCGEEARNFPAGYYVVDFPLRPVDLPEGIGAAFRFNLFDKEGVAGCEPVREHVLHGVLVSEFYRC